MSPPCAASRLPHHGGDPSSGLAKPVPRWVPGCAHTWLASVVIALLATGCGNRNQGNQWLPLREGETQDYTGQYAGQEPPHPPP